MPKIKKNRRSLFDRRKNDTKKNKISENKPPSTYTSCSSASQFTTYTQPDNSLLERNHPNSNLLKLKEHIEKRQLKWVTMLSSTSLQLLSIVEKPLNAPSIERTVSINSDLSWCVYVNGQLINSDRYTLLSKLSKKLSNGEDLITLLDIVLQAQLCPGNSDPEFVELIELEGGAFKGKNQEIVATLDPNAERKTVRRYDCEILCRPTSAGVRASRCSSCRKFRNHLRSKKSRHEHRDCSAVVACDSHTNYRHLNKEELEDRLKNVQKSRKLQRTQYKHVLKKIIKNEVTSFCALAPILIESATSHYLLSEVFCQDPIERYFSKQRHRGGGNENENPTVSQFFLNSEILAQRQQVGSALKHMNVQPESSEITASAYQPLNKRPRLQVKQLM